MAAARRSSESKAVVFMLVFLILAVAAICTTVAFYQKYANLRDHVATDQAAMKTGVADIFQKNGWPLDTYSPPVMGFVYSEKAFSEVGAKLNEAGQYEKQALPLLGWQSFSGIQDAVKNAPVQQEQVKAGQSPLSTMKGLLDYYETTTQQQSSTIGDLRGQVAALTTQKDALNTKLSQRETELGKQINDLQRQNAADKATAQKQYSAMVASFDGQRQQTQQADAKLQQEVNTHKADVSKYESQIAMLKAEIRKITVPGQGTRLTAEGRVISIDAQYDVVFMDGGKDKNRKVNDTFVVYDVGPSGADVYKAKVKVTDVYDTTSRASIVEQKELILPGDSFVSTRQWEMFHPSKPKPAAPAAAAPAAPAAAPAAGAGS